MLKIAITGGIASGKSMVGSFMAQAGCAVFECDNAAHDLMKPGNKCYRNAINEFGSKILNITGEINRSRLAKLVFSDARKLQLLNKLIHPEVKRAWRKWLKDQKASISVVIVPLLYEAGEGDGWDATCCVMTFRAAQIRRLKERGISEAQALRRITAQISVLKKAELADYVIINSGSVEMLKEQAEKILNNIMERKYGTKE